MNIVSWNLLNIGRGKLKREVNPSVAKAGVGNNGLDYIVKAVMGDAIWSSAGAAPVDIFVIIELKCGGGDHKGHDATEGAAPFVLTWLTEAMNTVANTAKIDKKYEYVPPLITGNRETVGIIYNSKELKYLSSGVLRRASDNNYFLPRTPFGAAFTALNVKNTPMLSVIGVHAPPKGGAAAIIYREPIKFCRDLADTTVFDPDAKTGAKNALLVGDFNCNPDSTFLKDEDMLTPFEPLNQRAYAANLTSASYTSLRNGLDNDEKPPLNYLSDAYDNVVSRLPDVATKQSASVLDFIAHAPGDLYKDHLQMLFNAYWLISNHLPVAMTFN